MSIPISGFTFIRNAVQYDYPILECLESMVDLVDELVINVGNSSDQTDQLLEPFYQQHKHKISIIRSIWDDTKTKNGLILSEQTNIALAACKNDWALYLQADEAIHQLEHQIIKDSLVRAEQLNLEAVRFRYFHFYSGYSLVERSKNWYPSEIRLIRKSANPQSYGDAQTFRKADGAMLKSELSDAHIFHYGHARAPQQMAQKIHYFHRFWHGDNHQKSDASQNPYILNYKNLVWYQQSHPACYKARIARSHDWTIQPKHFFDRQLKKIVIISNRQTTEIKNQLLAMVESHRFFEKTEVVNNPWQWLKCFLFDGYTKKNRILIDLTSNQKNILYFLPWSLDALVGFKRRIGFCDERQIKKFRAWVYQFIHFTKHQHPDGFELKQSAAEKARSLLAWAGLEAKL